MIIAHSLPPDITWSVAGPGAAILSPADLLSDDLPSTLTSIRWLSGTQNTGSVLHLRGDWSTPIAPGFAGLLNIRLPVGTKVQVSFRRAADPAGTYPYAPDAWNNPQRIYSGARGERTALTLLKPGASPVVGVDFAIYNDVDGVASIAANSVFQIGEAFARAMNEVDIEAEWTPAPIDTTTSSYSTDRGPFTQPGVIYHQLAFRLLADTDAMYFGDPADPAAIDYESLIAKVDRGQAAMYIPRYLDGNGAFSAHLLHRTAKLGVMTKLPAPTHRSGPYFDSSAVTVMETPIPT